MRRQDTQPGSPEQSREQPLEQDASSPVSDSAQTSAPALPDLFEAGSAESPRVVYVASVTHSGSTLVDLVLGSHSQLQSLGELKVLARSKREKLDRVLADRCTCGASNKAACGFWRGVEDRLQASIGGGLRDLDLDASDETTFVAHNEALFRAAVQVGGTPWIIDSSKSPRRLRRLIRSGAFDVRPLHLTRSPYGVTYSHIKKGRSTSRGALQYAKTRIALDWMLARQPHVTLRYEDFVADPAGEMGRVLGWLGLQFEPQQLDWTAHLHHNICGNHMRFTRKPEIRLDDAWRGALSPGQKAAIALLTSPARVSGLARSGSADAPDDGGQSSSTAR